MRDDDNQIGDTWDAVVAVKNKERDRQYQEDIDILAGSDLTFTVHNNGLHYIVYGKNHTIDYWPTKQKWISRTDKKVRYDVHKLISYARSAV